ncbi:hypothetical protein D918_08568 [Trichuris suis]|nr:hypothetical protein D918_08568 [Trichuris suis]
MTNSITTSCTLTLLAELFSRFGLPDTLVTDNAQWHRACLLPTYHPQSSGHAERSVDTFKRSLIKLKEEGTLSEILSTFLLRYCSSPNPCIQDCRSPAEMTFGKRVKTELTSLHPSAVYTSSNGRMAKCCNRYHGAKQRFISPGDLVYTRRLPSSNMTWMEGVIIRRRGKVVYDVRVGQENWRCHVSHLRPRQNENQNRTALRTLLETFDIEYPSRRAHRNVI